MDAAIQIQSRLDLDSGYIFLKLYTHLNIMFREGEMKDTVQLQDVMQVAITVTDLPRAKRFYQHVLGMQFLFEAGTLLFFQCGTVRLMVSTPEAPIVCGGTIIYFRVADLAATHRALEQNGVVFLEPPHLIAKMPDHDLWLSVFKDPDTNLIGLMSEIRDGESGGSGN